MPEQRRLNEQLLRLAPEIGLPLVVTNDLHYVHREQHEAHDVLLCVGTGNNLDTPNRMKFETRGLLPEVRGRDGGACSRTSREAIRNTRADRRDGRPRAAAGRAAHPALPGARRRDRRDLAAQGVRARASCGATARSRRSSRQRLDYELGVIISMGYAGYFLIVADFVRFAREQGIATTCRGSRAGLDRDLHAGHHAGRPDPLRAAVRALPQPRPRDDARHRRRLRGRAPRRGHRLRHAASTARTTSPRSSPSARCSPGPRSATSAGSWAWATARSTASPRPCPNQLGIKLDEALEIAPQLQARCTTPTRRSSKLIGPRPAARGRRAQRLHARRRRRHQPRAADRAHAAPAGDQLRRADDPVRDARHRGAGPAQVRLPGPVQPDDPAQGGRPDPRAPRRSTIDLDNIPLDDAKTFELLASGETTGVFQLESRGHAPLRPRAAADVGATTSRPWSRSSGPGPMDNIPAYIRRKHGQEQVDLPAPAARAVPGEDVRDLRLPGGHHGRRHRAGRLHRPRGGHAGLRDPQEEVVACCARRRRSSSARRPSAASSPQVIDAVFKAFEPFERYGFNKAHATCYGLIAYQTAYLKANYTVEYMTVGADRVPRQRGEGGRRHRRVPAPGHRGPAAGRAPLAASSSRSRATRSASACWRSRTSARARSSRSSRRARAGGEFRSLADFCTPGRPAAGQPQGARVAGQGRRAQHVRAPGAAPARARRRARRRPGRRSATGSPARRRCSTWAATTPSSLERPLPGHARDAGPRAAALGEGAARPVPVRPPAGRGRRAGRPVRDRVLAATSRTRRSTGSASSSAGS